MDAATLTAFAPALRAYLPWLPAAIDAAELTTPARLCAFFAQYAHETGGFTRLSEHLIYSADGLLKTFPKYFATHAIAVHYARQPEAIANRVYAGRLGNVAAGDGYKFRGRGWPHVTGRGNYAACSVALFPNAPDQLLVFPDVLAEPRYALMAGVWYWRVKRLNDYADVPGDEAFQSLTREINGGLHGYDDHDRSDLDSRVDWWLRAQSFFGGK